MAERVPIWYNVLGGLAGSAEAHGTVQNIAAQLHEELNLSLAIAVAEHDSDEIVCVASSGPAAPPIGTKLSVEQGICAACVRQNRLQLSNDTAIDPMLSAELCARLRIRSILSIPLRRHSRCVGLLGAFSDVAGRFELSLIERLRTEAARIECLFKTSPNVSARASEHIEFGFEAPKLESGELARASSEYRSWLGGFLAYARPISIAALTGCAFTMVTILPRTARSKTSVPHQQVLETAQQALHAGEGDDANFISNLNADNSKLQDLRQRANSGNVGAQRLLAARYERGDGLLRDSLKACVWYIIAGSNGDLEAKDRAVRLSHRLSQFQIAEIRFNVGKMYAQGTGVHRDLVAAYSWFTLAQAAGDIRARDEQEQLEASMTREQISEGLRRASDWLLAHRSGAGQHTRELAAIPQRWRSAR